MFGTSAAGNDNQPVVVTNSNEYLSALKTTDPLVHNVKCKIAPLPEIWWIRTLWRDWCQYRGEYKFALWRRFELGLDAHVDCTEETQCMKYLGVYLSFMYRQLTRSLTSSFRSKHNREQRKTANIRQTSWIGRFTDKYTTLLPTTIWLLAIRGEVSSKTVNYTSSRQLNTWSRWLSISHLLWQVRNQTF